MRKRPLASWAQRDPAKALEAARDVANKRMTTRQVRLGAIAAKGSADGPLLKQDLVQRILEKGELYWRRAKKKPAASGRSSDMRLLEDYLVDLNELGGELKKVGGELDAIVRRFCDFGGALQRPDAVVARNRRIDLIADRATSKGSSEWLVPIVVVGPYQLREHYVRKHPEWMMLATALLKFYRRSSLFLPWGADAAPFQRWLNTEDSAGQLAIDLVLCTRDGRFCRIGRTDNFGEIEARLRISSKIEPDAPDSCADDDLDAIASGFASFAAKTE